jgi:hypothetical protein
MAGIAIDDEELENMVGEYLRDVIARHARTILEHQMKDIVAGELARLRLTDPNMGAVQDAVNNALIPLVDDRLRITLGPLVREEIRKTFSNIY